MSEFETVIGLEIHVQSSTATKMFCWCSNNSFGKDPNVNICPICTGHPGQLPVINREAVKKGIAMSLSLNCKINTFSKFDRKNYFYPDLPKGYQISQFDKPLAENGFLEIKLENGEKKKIGITRLHLEEDAGKLTHTAGGTLVDFNRSGCPLMEIVSEPDIRSAAEAVLYAKEMQKIARVVDASTADMEKGMMRFDINISVRKKGEEKFGTKVEIKNLNSFKFLEKAIEFEEKRQIEMVLKSEKIIQETRGWDEINEVTVSQRSKEEAQDYRYFPEPDLPPLEFNEEELAKIKSKLPELPSFRSERLQAEYKLSEEESLTLCEDYDLADFFESVALKTGDAAKASSLILSFLLGFLKKDNLEISESPIKSEALSDVITRVNNGEISLTVAKTVLEEIYNKPDSNAEEIIKNKNLGQISDHSKLAEICDKVVQLNQESVKDYLDGKERAFGFLVGQVMKASGGKANPQLVAQILKEKLK